MIEKKVYEKLDVLSKYQIILDQVDPLRPSGKVQEVSGMAIYTNGPEVKIGEICRVVTSKDGAYLPCEVVGFNEKKAVLMPMGPLYGVFPGCTVLATGRPLTVPLGKNILGRVLDGTATPIDGKGAIFAPLLKYIDQNPPNPHSRPLIRKALSTGIKSIDGLLTIGRGQRIGIFAGSGVGKSSLLGMIARYTDADVNIIALVGERGRELREFIENDLGKAGLEKSVVIAATSDKPAIHKISCAMTATTIAEYFRDEGYNVNLMMDSITRFATAQREIGASTREPVITRGYPPSVFAKLSRLVERTGTSKTGTITGFYTVLIDADDLNDPVADAVRGYLDGHIVLDRAIAAKNHYPAIDILNSVSRVMPKIISKEHLRNTEFIRKYMAIFSENEDFIKIGSYQAGSDPDVDLAIELNKIINNFLIQPIEERISFDETVMMVNDIFKNLTNSEDEELY